MPQRGGEGAARGAGRRVTTEHCSRLELSASAFRQRVRAQEPAGEPRQGARMPPPPAEAGWDVIKEATAGSWRSNLHLKIHRRPPERLSISVAPTTAADCAPHLRKGNGYDGGSRRRQHAALVSYHLPLALRRLGRNGKTEGYGGRASKAGRAAPRRGLRRQISAPHALAQAAAGSPRPIRTAPSASDSAGAVCCQAAWCAGGARRLAGGQYIILIPSSNSRGHQ